jgi:hypothetical protein
MALAFGQARIRQAKSEDRRSNLAPRHSARIIAAQKAESKSMA